jgi:hypothetical protein
MIRCNIKLQANFQPDLPVGKESIVGSFFDDAVKMGQSPMDKGLIDGSIENFLQR